ncbi:MAG: hypothetical protein IPG59_01905 [Candidatus Melainabacteria bacterium]|nr:MAG: hypothetical protein IPG59_01905 [Candidatus Melainabacteria bacterium]
MSKDNRPEEAEKRPEPGLKEAAKTEASIATPKEQNTWHQSQESHYIPEDESATHLALRPDQLNDLKAQGLAEKFEIVGFEDLSVEATKGIKLFGPLENILKEGLISKSFLEKLEIGLREIPSNERKLLENAGVKIKAKEKVDGHQGSGSPSVFEPSTNEAIIGMSGTILGNEERVESHQVQGQMFIENRDIAGSLKHELGHALFYALKIDNWSDFKRISQTEKQKLDEETRGHLEHLLENDNELFAETYALIRGRHTSRTEWLNFGFPDTVALVKKMLNQQAGQKDQ